MFFFFFFVEFLFVLNLLLFLKFSFSFFVKCFPFFVIIFLADTYFEKNAANERNANLCSKCSLKVMVFTNNSLRKRGSLAKQ